MSNRNKERLVVTSVIALVAAMLILPPSLPAAEKDAASIFNYDRSAPIDLKEVATREADRVIIKDISYAAYAPDQGRAVAYLVTPKGSGSFAGVLFFHWLGEVKSDRNEFLEEATALARRGVVSLLIQGFFPWKVAPKDGATDRRRIIEQTIEVRRGLDLLLAQPGVDAKRIGYVGHDYGAMFGSIVSGFDKRAKAYVLMAGTGSFSEWSLKYWPKTAAQGEAAYRQAVDELDPVRYVAKAEPAAFLFQFANSDKYIPKEAASAFFNAASKPKDVKWYEAIHDLQVPAAHKDRDEWLAQQLALTK